MAGVSQALLDDLRARLASRCATGLSATNQSAARPEASRPICPTGFDALDRVLPEQGWPVGAISEILHNTAGIGELALALPALARLTQQGRIVAWLDPPHIPYAPALREQGLALEQVLVVRAGDPRALLWAAEQLLRCANVGAVLAWPGAIDDRHVRRLQLAAETGGACGLLYRPASAAQSPSPAALRLRLHSECGGLKLEVLKVRGGYPHAVVVHPSAAAVA